MNAPNLPPTLRALVAVAQPLLSTASALVGLGAIAYLVGWRETQSYYSTIGAPWVASLLSPSRMMQTSSWILWITLTFAFSSIFSIADSHTTHHGIRCWAIALLGAGLSLQVIDSLPLDQLSAGLKASLLSLGALCFAASAGLTLAEVVARYKEDGFRWHSYYLWLFFFVVLLTLSWAPSRMGEARARLAMQLTSTSLPQVELAVPDSTASWRLLEVTDNSAILLSLGTTASQNRFRVVNLSEMKAVGSTSATR